jgi:hypothetical protein
MDVTLAERWNGKPWAIQPTPNPARAQQSRLWAVACASASACTAVGTATKMAGNQVTLAERWAAATGQASVRPAIR